MPTKPNAFAVGFYYTMPESLRQIAGQLNLVQAVLSIYNSCFLPCIFLHGCVNITLATAKGTLGTRQGFPFTMLLLPTLASAEQQIHPLD